MHTAHPFDSEDDRQQRRKQREVVLQVSKQDRDAVCINLPKPNPVFTGHAERWLRTRADVLIERHGRLFDEDRSETTSVQVRDLLSKAGRAPTPEAHAARRQTDKALPLEVAGTWTSDQWGDVVHLIELLTWADDIADDGYSARPTSK